MKSKYTPKLRDEICDLIGAGNNRKDAITIVGLTEETFYKWLRKEVKDRKTGELVINTNYHPDLEEHLSVAEARFKSRNITIIQRAALGRKGTRTITKTDGTVVKEDILLEKPNWTASAWLLERKYKNEYAQRQEFSGSDGEKLESLVIYKPEKNNE